MKRLLLIGILALLAGSGFAQPSNFDKDVPDERKERIKKRVETMRIWKLTEALSLDEERAMVFFPRYRTYMAEEGDLKKQIFQSGHKIEKGFNEDENIDYSAEYDKLKENIETMQKHQFDFIESNSDILSIKEKAALLVFEMRFERALHKMLMDIWREEGAPPPRHGDMNRPEEDRRHDP